MSVGEQEASEYVASLVYRELHRLAAAVLNPGNPCHSLQPTLLVNEAFLRLMKGQPVEWQDRSHFFALMARMMRRIVVDHFRNQGAQKRVSPQLRLSLEDAVIFSDDHRDEVLMVDEALHDFSKVDARAAKVVELRYFGGLETGQIAGILGVSSRTVKRDWQAAKWWLERHFSG